MLRKVLELSASALWVWVDPRRSIDCLEWSLPAKLSLAAKEEFEALCTVLKLGLRHNQTDNQKTLSREIEEMPRIHEYTCALQQPDGQVLIRTNGWHAQD